MLYCDEADSTGEENYVESVALRKDKTENAFKRREMSGGGHSGKRGVEGCWWRSELLLMLRVLDELQGDEAIAFGVFRSCSEQVDVKTGVYSNSDDILNVTYEGCFFENVEGECKGSEQHFGLTLVPCRCGVEKERYYGERKFDSFSCSSGSEWGSSVETRWGVFCHRCEVKKIKEGEKRGKIERQAAERIRGCNERSLSRPSLLYRKKGL